MIYSDVGSSTLKVSRIGFGCMSLPADEKAALLVVQKALDAGINYLDTADIYNDGVNEVTIGKAIKGKRDKIVLASKAGNVKRPDGGLDWNPSKKHILSSIEGSLKRLQTDYIDLYQLHGGTINDNIDETIGAFEQLKKEGKIRYYGISSIRPNVIKEYINRSSIVSVMTQFSLLDRRPEEEILELLHQHNIAVLVRGSVAQGLLINKAPKAYLDYPADDVAKLATSVHELCSPNRTATQIAIKYVLQHRAVCSAVVGIRTIEQVEEAVKSLSVADLSENELDKLKTVLEPNKYKEHR